MKTKSILFLFGLSILYSCTVTLKELTQADADHAKTKFASATLESLNEGKSIYQVSCTKCHGLKKPSSLTEEKWNKIVPIMVKKTNKAADKEEIDAIKQEKLLQYLLTMRDAKKHK